MEFIPFGNIHKLFATLSTKKEFLPFPQLFPILIGVAEALALLHGQNILHLNVKPGNILLDGDLEPHFGDF
jgi:serine/threonine protein kinase